jgi:hypothetical protein
VATLVVKEELDPTWYLNTMATQHMCFEKEFFTNYKVYNNSPIVYLSDNFTHIFQGQGDVTITPISGIEKQIPNVLYVPKLRKICFQPSNLIKLVEKYTLN